MILGTLTYFIIVYITLVQTMGVNTQTICHRLTILPYITLPIPIKFENIISLEKA